MRKICLSFLVSLFSICAFSQAPQIQFQKPIFSNVRDSVEYYKIVSAINGIMSDPEKRKSYMESRSQLDSLMRLQALFRDKIIGYRITYSTNKKFSSYADLKSGSVKPESITQLSLSDSKLKSIPAEVYRCTNLEEIELVNTSIKKLPGRLNKLTKLKAVYVYNNNSRGHLVLGRNTRVRALLIRGVKSEYLPRTYKQFRMLDTLDLSRNIGLSTFPNIYKNKELNKLNLLENIIDLKDLKPIANQSLEELNLMRNRIKEVPDAIGSFTGLKKVAFNYNEIASVKPGLAKLKNLESISFYQNKLEAIPVPIYEMTSLQVIDLYYNQVKSVDPEITNLRNLRVLFLANNKLMSLPANFGELSNLRALYLHNNRLIELPESMQKMESLKILRINNNQFTLFPTAVLDLKGLENLDVSQNFLHQFPTELSGFTKLQILAVGDNPWENPSEVKRTAQALEPGGTIVHGK